MRVLPRSCFFPYPALAIVGGSTGLQLSQMLTLLVIPLLFTQAPGRGAFIALVVLLSVVYLSGRVNRVAGEVPAIEIQPKEPAALTLALLILWPADWVTRREVFGMVLDAALVAIIGARGDRALPGLQLCQR